MSYRDINQLSFLDNAFQELDSLQCFANKVKQAPKILKPNSEVFKKKVCPQQETHKNSSFNSQNKDSDFLTTPTKSTSEIISFIGKLSPLDFTNNNIQIISAKFRITDIHLRSLITSVCRYKYKV